MSKVKGVEELVGGAVVAGCLVRGAGSGAARIAGAAVGGVLGAAGQVAAEMAGESRGGASPLPAKAWGLGFLGLTDGELVLLEAKQAMLGSKAVGVLARAPRGAVAGFDLGSGTLSAPLTVRFADGVEWPLEVPRAELKGARELIAAAGG